MKCAATTKKGTPCTRNATQGEYCATHIEGAKVGRATKLTPEVQKKIVDAVALGNYASVAAGAAGISRSSYFLWMQIGADDAAAGRKTIHSEFADAVKRAEHEAEGAAVAYVRSAMRENWQAAMTYLERKFPDRWGRHDRHEISGPNGGPIEVNDALNDPEVRKAGREFRRRVEAARAQQSGGSGSGD